MKMLYIIYNQNKRHGLSDPALTRLGAHLHDSVIVLSGETLRQSSWICINSFALYIGTFIEVVQATVCEFVPLRFFFSANLRSIVSFLLPVSLFFGKTNTQMILQVLNENFRKDGTVGKISSIFCKEPNLYYLMKSTREYFA